MLRKPIPRPRAANAKQRPCSQPCLQPIMPVALETLAADYFPISVTVQGQGWTGMSESEFSSLIKGAWKIRNPGLEAGVLGWGLGVEAVLKN